MALDGRRFKRESWGTKPSRWRHPKLAKIPAEQDGKVAIFQTLVANVMAVFRIPRRRGNHGRSSSFRLVPRSTDKVAGNWRYVRVRFAVWVGFGSAFGSFLSLSLSRVNMFPLFPASFFIFIYFPLTAFFFSFLHMLHLVPLKMGVMKILK